MMQAFHVWVTPYRFAGFSSLKLVVAFLSLTGIISVTIFLHPLIELSDLVPWGSTIIDHCRTLLSQLESLLDTTTVLVLFILLFTGSGKHEHQPWMLRLGMGYLEEMHIALSCSITMSIGLLSMTSQAHQMTFWMGLWRTDPVGVQITLSLPRRHNQSWRVIGAPRGIVSTIIWRAWLSKCRYRVPVVIFLSDGECNIADETVRDLCRRSVALGWVAVNCTIPGDPPRANNAMF